MNNKMNNLQFRLEHIQPVPLYLAKWDRGKTGKTTAAAFTIYHKIAEISEFSSMKKKNVKSSFGALGRS